MQVGQAGNGEARAAELAEPERAFHSEAPQNVRIDGGLDYRTCMVGFTPPWSATYSEGLRLRDAFPRFCKNLFSKVTIIDRPRENECTNHS
jgi:hypothetical protein